MLNKNYHTIIKIGLLITAAQLLMASGCNKNGTTPCISGTPRYSFTATSEFTPQKEVYNVGDTIFLTSTIPKILIDQISNQQIDYSNSVGVGGSITFGLMDTISKQGVDAYSKFNTLTLIGTNSLISNVPNKGIISNYDENSNFQFKIRIIVKEKGNKTIPFNVSNILPGVYNIQVHCKGIVEAKTLIIN